MSARARDLAFTFVFVLVGLVAGVLGTVYAAQHHVGELTLVPVFVGLGTAAIGGWWTHRALRRTESQAPAWGIVPRPSTLGDTERASVHAFRGAAAPPALSSARTSTRRVVLAVVLASLVTAAVVPFALHLPKWLEAETVLGGWWLTWSVVLGVLAYRGRPLDRAHDLSAARRLTALVTASGDVSEPVVVTAAPTASRAPAPPRSLGRRIFSVLGEILSADLEGLLLFLAAGLVIAGAAVAAWLVVDLVIPIVFFVAYAGVACALRRAIASAHRGRALRSACHGVAWATAYVAPLAAVVALLHVTLAR